jgi:arabinose-5-phosphate isomerase
VTGSPRTISTSAGSAADVLRHEAAAIAAAAERMDPDSFTRAAEMLASCAGNVATVGAGTSGIVAQKIAATLTSTGTPAVFVHPSDALHGGLGVIASQDVVIAVSNSGETEEVSVLLPYLRSRDVQVIAIVGRLDSGLARQASVALEAFAEREAGGLGLVPTASAAVALARGDALALTVMEMKGVTPEGFAANHPSGQLGRRLTLRVRDVMHAGGELPAVGPDAPLLDVLGEMTSGGLGAVTVLGGGGRLEGIVTDGDVRRTVQRCDASGLTSLRARDFMTPEPVVIGQDAMAYDALRLMEDRPSQIAVLPVVEEDRCVGLVRLHDLVRIGL